MLSFTILFSVLTYAYSKRYFEGIEAVVGTIVHIDLKMDLVWYRYRSPGGSGPLGAIDLIDVTSNADRRQWYYTEEANGMQFESIFHSGYYLCVDSSSFKLELTVNSANAYCQWAPYPATNDTTKLQNIGTGNCVESNGISFEGNGNCDTSNRHHIVPLFPCSQNIIFSVWFNGLSLNISDGKWRNLLDTGSDLNIPNTAHYASKFGNLGLVGYSNISVTFPVNIPAVNWTLFAAVQYHHDDNQNRIIQCETGDCAIGSNNKEQGVLYIDGKWVTSSKGYNTTFTYLVAKDSEFRANGYQRTIYDNTASLLEDEQFCINCGANIDTYSDFEIYELLIALDDIDMSIDGNCWDTYFSLKYNTSLVSINPSPSPTIEPTLMPFNPTNIPTRIPTETPTRIPTENPTELPSINPTMIPSNTPTNYPSFSPTYQPSNANEQPVTEYQTSSTLSISVDENTKSIDNSEEVYIIVCGIIGLLVVMVLVFFIIKVSKRKRRQNAVITELATTNMDQHTERIVSESTLGNLNTNDNPDDEQESSDHDSNSMYDNDKRVTKSITTTAKDTNKNHENDDSSDTEGMFNNEMQKETDNGVITQEYVTPP